MNRLVNDVQQCETKVFERRWWEIARHLSKQIVPAMWHNVYINCKFLNFWKEIIHIKYLQSIEIFGSSKKNCVAFR